MDTLNDYEKNIIKLIIINGYSPAEIAKKMGKSRQAINQAKIRPLNNLKNFI
ncbi:sigma factor-like helix-turn-helix DNA-binding protein [uncultured Clostridium sp.]|uniref:sigma factor-like helix-turn-helix DNA-binding protein n=1 Tax=uncultured Clostridium sp. TaxID=59620 RepID=UPI0034575107